MPGEQVVEHRDAGTAADADHGADPLDLLGLAQRTAQVLDGVTHAERRQHGGALADDLEDDGDGAVGRVAVRDGERHPLPRVVDAQYDELSRADLARDLGASMVRLMRSRFVSSCRSTIVCMASPPDPLTR